MSVLIGGCVSADFECPFGFPEFVARCRATDIEIDDDLRRGPHWSRLSGALAEFSGCSSDDMDRCLTIADELRGAWEQYSDLVNDIKFGDHYETPWLNSPEHCLRLWSNGIAESDWNNLHWHDYTSDVWKALGDLRDISPDEFRSFFAELTARVQSRQNGRRVRKESTRARRQEFGAKRDDLVLALLASGAPYRCAVHGCTETDGLTIDHIVALSRGGTDDIPNLQFMCRPHNSAKGARAA